jgi:superfamily II DNA helicase RecQ
MEIDTALSEIESKYDFTFKEKQLTAIESIIDNKDTCIVLPTGYGKSKMYVLLPEIYELVNNVQGTVLVISPLQYDIVFYLFLVLELFERVNPFFR